MDEPGDLAAVLAPFTELLEGLGVTWYAGGSVASTVHGHFRATNAFDVIARLRDDAVSSPAVISRPGLRAPVPGSVSTSPRTAPGATASGAMS